MEPAKLNSPDPADAKLEALLREHASATLPDDGFSLQVLARLPDAEPSPRAAIAPSQPNRFPAWSRTEVAGAVGMISLLLVQLFGGTSTGAETALRQIGTAFSPMVEAVLDPQLLLALGITAGVLLLLADDGDETDQAR